MYQSIEMAATNFFQLVSGQVQVLQALHLVECFSVDVGNAVVRDVQGSKLFKVIELVVVDVGEIVMAEIKCFKPRQTCRLKAACNTKFSIHNDIPIRSVWCGGDSNPSLPFQLTLYPLDQ